MAQCNERKKLFKCSQSMLLLLSILVSVFLFQHCSFLLISVIVDLSLLLWCRCPFFVCPRSQDLTSIFSSSNFHFHSAHPIPIVLSVYFSCLFVIFFSLPIFQFLCIFFFSLSVCIPFNFVSFKCMFFFFFAFSNKKKLFNRLSFACCSSIGSIPVSPSLLVL